MKPEAVEGQLKQLTPRAPAPDLDDRIRASLDNATPALFKRSRRFTASRYAAAPVALVLILAAVYGINGVFAAAPRIQFEQERINLGLLPEHEVASKMIGVANQGQRPLKIKRVTTTCGCTVATFERFIVQPGQATNMVVTIDPAKVKHPYGTKQLVVFSNDPKRPQAQLEVTAESENQTPQLGYIN